MDSDHEEEGLRATIKELNATIARLRASRDSYRAKNQELEATIATLLIKSEEKEEAIQLDSDKETKRLIKSQQMKRLSITGNNKKYSDVPLFYGAKDQWDAWRFHLDAKFRQSAVLFPSEIEKMDYIRDHCKGIAFDVLRARVDPTSDDPFVTANEMIAELHSMFGEYDQVSKCDTMLHRPDFGMGLGSKKNETFDEFYARFSATIAPLGLSETSKISNLQRLITRKLRLMAIDGMKQSFRQYVDKLRRCDQNIRRWGLDGSDLDDFDHIDQEEEEETNEEEHPNEK